MLLHGHILPRLISEHETGRIEGATMRIPTQTSTSIPATKMVLKTASCRLLTKAMIIFILLIIIVLLYVQAQKGHEFSARAHTNHFTLCYAAGVGIDEGAGILTMRQPSLMSTRYTRVRLRP